MLDNLPLFTKTSVRASLLTPKRTKKEIKMRKMKKMVMIMKVGLFSYLDVFVVRIGEEIERELREC